MYFCCASSSFHRPRDCVEMQRPVGGSPCCRERLGRGDREICDAGSRVREGFLMLVWKNSAWCSVSVLFQTGCDESKGAASIHCFPKNRRVVNNNLRSAPDWNSCTLTSSLSAQYHSISDRNIQCHFYVTSSRSCDLRATSFTCIYLLGIFKNKSLS